MTHAYVIYVHVQFICHFSEYKSRYDTRIFLEVRENIAHEAYL